VSSRPLPSYAADDLTALLAVLPDADSVELKLTVPRADQRTVARRLGIDSIDAQIRQVVFVDTPDLELSAAGLVIRARRTQRKPADVTVKLRPMLPGEAPSGMRSLPGFKTEIDASPAGFVCSCSLTHELPDRKVKKLIDGDRSVEGLLDDGQEALLSRLPEGVELRHLRVLGPVHVLKCKWRPAGFARRMVAELWLLPGGANILELSTKSAPHLAFQAAAETKSFLADHGVDLGAPQELKTASAMAAVAGAHLHRTIDKEPMS
jgi:hypothetical protein